MSKKPKGSAMSDDQGEDKRKKLRAPLLVLKVRLDDGAKVFFGYAANISRGGIFIASANPRAPGSRFQLELTLPEEPALSFQATCEVVWKREYSLKSTLEPGMGLRFVDLAHEVAERIDAWVQRQTEEE